MDLLAFLFELSLLHWAGIVLGGAVWLGLTWWLGNVAEKRGGDRESGALVGFFLPGLVVIVIWWLMYQ
ncbi:hypothetical protein [Sansalvadorimonas verongulae]|uniref:hypothetical protein n=1 Tax=Sansalvadorimonas verongulae TaxID=2172824 RepID=UPI0012BBB25D|nr:hypothetical protein [Sansalvadorimonas verongulae]MTI13618.1 hypothetical protein [Sansalvadorimonas verongulae]